MSLSTSYWGEPVWKTLYSVAYTYPDNPSAEFREYVAMLYKSIAQVLPCEECRQDYHNFLEQNPIQQATTDRLALLTWVNSLENCVNRKLNLPAILLNNRIAEMDRHNPTIPQQVVKTRPQKFSRPGSVSYGVRRTVVNNVPPTSRQPTVSDTARQSDIPQQQARRQRQTVSYGIRRPRDSTFRRSGCTSCN